ncbi:MAG: pantothenate kinase [Betaproteobacteria bacterium]|nr:pantothenate kinase [Betaproteobacteria bacterium]
MKLLAIDAGNSRIKWGSSEAGEWLERGAVATAQAHELSEALRRLPAPGRIVVANVAGDTAGQSIRDALAPFSAAPAWVVSREAQCGVRSGYAQPAQLGPDRWAALIGARHLYDGPCVVVNAGTTMTVDALSADGLFLGGCIVPGYSLMKQALAGNTARLGLQDGAFSFFPDNTGDAIASGAVNALAGAIERMKRYMTQSGEADALVMLSGGDAGVLTPLLNESVQVVDNLVLEGLMCIGANDG